MKGGCAHNNVRMCYGRVIIQRRYRHRALAADAVRVPLAYVGNGKFMMTEGRDGTAVQFTYAARLSSKSDALWRSMMPRSRLLTIRPRITAGRAAISSIQRPTCSYSFRDKNSRTSL